MLLHELYVGCTFRRGTNKRFGYDGLAAESGCG
jgi:hypothetical protein